MHVVAQRNHREFSCTSAQDCELLLAHLHAMVRTYAVTVDAYTLMSNHVHPAHGGAPTHEALGRPLRWVMTETARAFHQARGRRGHFWERRDRAVVVEDALDVLAALRDLDRNPVRAGLVLDPTIYPWSSGAAYALGVANPVTTLHPSYLALSPYPKVRQRQYRALLAPSPEATADGRDPRWSSQRAVGTAACVARYTPPRGRRRIVSVPPHIQALGA